jgi:hypothetical protein
MIDDIRELEDILDGRWVSRHVLPFDTKPAHRVLVDARLTMPTNSVGREIAEEVCRDLIKTRRRRRTGRWH